MPNLSTVSFANLICRFGEKYVLLDFAKEIVLPPKFVPARHHSGFWPEISDVVR
ncbi:MAG: hypothetical protein ABSF54_02265 [Bryobacteraceae bacterium]|jgi:hypothetical protein